MFEKEELRELKYSLNTTIAARQEYKIHETIKSRLYENEKHLAMDYSLLKKVIKLLEEE